MKALFAAIETLFTGSALDTALDGKLFLYEAPQDIDVPFAVYMMESDNSDYTFDSKSHEISLVFFVESSEGNAVEVCDNLELLEALFDDCKLAVSGYRFLRMERKDVQLVHEPGENWQYMARYRILLEEE